MNQSGFKDRDNDKTINGSAKPGFFYGYIIAGSGFVIWLVGGIYSPVFGVFLKPMLDEFGWTRAEATLGYSLSAIVSGVLAIIMGRLTDRLGPKVVVMVFGSFLGISYLLMSQITVLWQFQLCYILVLSVGMSAILIPVMSIIARWFVRRRGFITGIVQSGVGVGGLIIAPFAAWLIMSYGWRLSYVIVGIFATGAIILSGLLLRRGPENITQLPGSKIGETKGITEKIGGYVARGGFSLRQAINTRQFWIVAGLYFSFGFCRSAFLPHTAAYVQDKGFSLFDGANVVAVLTFSSLFGRITMGRVADIIGNRPALIISEVLTTISLALGLVTVDLWGLYLYGVIFGFGWGAQAVLRFALASEEFGLASIGAVMGALGLAEAIAASVGSYLAGYIFDIAGSYQPAFWLGIAISIMGILLAQLKQGIHISSG
jgi:MFS family permease